MANITAADNLDPPEFPPPAPQAGVIQPTPVAGFVRDLRAATPRVWVAHVIIAANVLVFLLMCARGVSFFQPTAESVIPWGADFGPKTLNGQQWRLFTSMFIHFGIIHIGVNMLVLFQIGPLVERLLGNFAFFVAYVLSGLFGSLLSVYIHPQIVSAGASGAIFGVYGVMFGFLLMQRGVIPKPVLVSLSKGAVVFVGYNLFYGATAQGIDMSAHLGGLTSGFVLGVAMNRRLVRGDGVLRAAIVLVVGMGLTFIAAHRIPRPVDIDAILTQSDQVESSTIDKYNQSLTAWHAGKLTNQQMTDILQNQILIPYSADIDRLNKLKGNDKIDQSKLEAIIAYHNKRRDAFQALIQAIKSKNPADIERANQLGREADALINKN